MKKVIVMGAVIAVSAILFTALNISAKENGYSGPLGNGGKVSFLVLGDSIAAGYGIDEEYLRYCNIVCDTMGYELTNDAVSGDTTVDLISKIGQDSTARNIKNADMIAISIGGNNVLRMKHEKLIELVASGSDSQQSNNLINSFSEDINKIYIEIRKINKDCIIYLQTIYNPFHAAPNAVYSLAEEFIDDILPNVNSRMAELTKSDDKLFIVDVCSEFKKSQDCIADDGIHPSQKGHKKIAQLYINMLRSQQEQQIIPIANK